MSGYFNAEQVPDIIPTAYVQASAVNQNVGDVVTGAVATINLQPGPDVTLAVANEPPGDATELSGPDNAGNTITFKLTPNALASVKCNDNGGAAPGANDDTLDGYAIFSVWIDKSVAAPYDVYLCTDATAAAAKWARLT